MKKIELSLANQMQDNRRIVTSETGVEYDLSFIPAIVNRKYYKVWSSIQTEIMKILPNFLSVRQRITDGVIVPAEDMKIVDDFTKLSTEAVEAGNNIILTVMAANGYKDFTEDNLYTEFSEVGISKLIDFCVGIDRSEAAKKKAENKLKA